MKPIAIIFVLAQFLDLFTTLFGFYIGAGEGNPIGFTFEMLICKLLVIILGFVILQFLKVPRIAWVVIIISSIAPAWNMLVILAEFIE